MPYKPRDQVTLAHVRALITRLGFTDVTDDHTGEAACSWIDENGTLNQSGSLASARDLLIMQHVLRQNSL